MDFSIWTIVGIVAAAFTSFSFIPQVSKMWRRKSAKDVSNVTMMQMIAGSVLWLIYGISRTDFVIIGANVVGIAILVVGLAMYYRYHVKDE
jgi:MtN3 and saliva related transmembrane protein